LLQMPAAPKTPESLHWAAGASQHCDELVNLASQVTTALKARSPRNPAAAVALATELAAACDRTLKWIDAAPAPGDEQIAAGELSAAAGVLRNASWVLLHRPEVPDASADAAPLIPDRLVTQGLLHLRSATEALGLRA